MADSYDTLYLEAANTLQYPFLMMGGKLVLSLDKRDHNSTVDVMCDQFVGMILALKGCSSRPDKDCTTEAVYCE
jgi:hypothetical protein